MTKSNYLGEFPSLEGHPTPFEVDDENAADWLKRQVKKTGKTAEQVVADARTKVRTYD